MYDPVTARFLQADTYLGNLNDPLSLNLYTYCLNNPERYTDPSGHFAITAGIILSALFWGVLNTSIAIISGGLANGGRMAARSFGRMMLAEAGLGVAEGIIGDTGRQLIGGTKFRELDYGHIAATGVLGGFSGVGGALLGEGIGAGVNELRNSRVVSNVVDKMHGMASKGANAIKRGFERIAVKNGKSVGLDAVTDNVKSPRYKMNLQFFAGDEGYKGGKKSFVDTPYGKAYQEYTEDALKVKQYVNNGGKVYRGGTIGRSKTVDAQFWAIENPLTPGYANKYGVDFSSLDYIMEGTVKDGTNFITRQAPGLGKNVGGGIEVVTPPNSVEFRYFYMIGGDK